jgi:hypothetical protein
MTFKGFISILLKAKRLVITPKLGIIIIVFNVVVEGCDFQDGKLNLINKSKDTIFYIFSFGSDSIDEFPLRISNKKYDYGNSFMIKPLDSQFCLAMDPWENIINKSNDRKLRVFFFKKDLINTAGKDSILNKQLYTKKEKLSVEDLDNLNWRVVYDD